ncbi:hypothetical protein Dimus_004876 [Dionaea muscipula]
MGHPVSHTHLDRIPKENLIPSQKILTHKENVRIFTASSVPPQNNTTIAKRKQQNLQDSITTQQREVLNGKYSEAKNQKIQKVLLGKQNLGKGQIRSASAYHRLK